MSSLDSIAVMEPLRRAVETHRLAHAFLIIGSPEGQGRQLATALTQMLFCSESVKPCGRCDGCRRIAARTHPDVYWLEPEKKSRIIPVGDINNRTKDPGIRFGLLEPLSKTAYAGEWKVGIIMWADRMKDQATNALLKTLEEPPKKTLIILVTDEPQNLLPTILSRCQRLNLGEPERPPDASWRADLEKWLAEPSARGPLTALARASRLRALLDSLKTSINAEGEEGESSDEGADEPESTSGGGSDADSLANREVQDARGEARLHKERVNVLRAILYWQRDLLACRLNADERVLHYPEARALLTAQAASLDVGSLLNRIKAVEVARVRFDSNISPLLVLESLVQSGI